MASAGKNWHARRKRLASDIESSDLSLIQQREIYRELSESGVTSTRNENGVFIDIYNLADEIVCRVERILAFCRDNAAMLSRGYEQPPKKTDEDHCCSQVDPPGKAGKKEDTTEDPKHQRSARRRADHHPSDDRAATATATAPPAVSRHKELAKFQQWKKKYSRPC